VPYLGNTNSNEFHDLARVKPQCQIAEILPRYRKTFVPDTIGQAISEGFEPCSYCLGTFATVGIAADHQLAPSADFAADLPPAAPADLAAEDIGGGRVSLTWMYPVDINEFSIRFDVYASGDPLEPLRRLVLGGHGDLAAVVEGFTAGGDVYFTVIARRGPLLSLPSRIVRVSVQPILATVTLSAGARGALPSAPGFPLRINPAGRVQADSGDSLLRGKILQLLLTSPGERVNLPDFGTRLRELVFDPNNDVLAAVTEFAVNRALQKFLGDELHVDGVQVANVDNELTVDIVYLRKADLRTERLRVGIPIPE
jgi:Bacteriophage baseplate protein W